MKRRTYRCTICNLTVTCIGTVVAHRCKNYKLETRQKVWDVLDEEVVISRPRRNGKRTRISSSGLSSWPG